MRYQVVFLSSLSAAGKIVMGTRMYDPNQGAWGVLVSEGVANFRDIEFSGYSER